MVNYSCEKCGKTFKQKGHYMKHLQRKTPCDNIKDKIENIVEKKVDELVKETLQDLVEKGDIEIKNKNLILNNQNSNIEHTEMEGQKIKFIDLFCGIGGFHQALSGNDYECVFASDIDKKCRETYEKNYKITPEGDITKVNVKDIPEFNILCGGFPCQPFSKAGNQDGFDDKRGDLFFTICDIVKYHKPEYIILENVRNLATHDNGNTWKTIKENINELNYYTYDNPLILNTLHFGVPQSRERAVILCVRKDIDKLPDLPEIPKIVKAELSVSINDIIHDDEEYNKTYKITEREENIIKIWDNFIDILNKNEILVPKFPIWTDWWDSDGDNTNICKINKKLTDEENLKKIKEKKNEFYNKYKSWIDKNREFYIDNKEILEEWLNTSRKNKHWYGALRKLEWQVQNKNVNLSDNIFTFRPSGIRVKDPNYTPTLVAMSHIPIVGFLKRKLSPRECLNLQSFNPDFILSENDKDTYKQAGNAVNKKMINACINLLINKKPLF
jgi:DNA (cytosine-5)-methyltransferase 1